MSDSRDESLSDVMDHFERWLAQGLTRCSFAASFVKGRPTKRLLVFGHTSEPEPAFLDSVLDHSAEKQRSVAVVLPSLRSEAEIVAYLRRLEGAERWSVSHESPGDGRLHLSVGWRTAEGHVCELMGFAPLPSMPVTRRAPYVALAGWAGRRMNPYKPFDDVGDVVGFVDAAHGLRKGKHDRWWDATVKNVRRLMVLPPDDARKFHHVTFALSTSSGWPNAA
jgi:hypothetical protein